jgi:hypothetical protein
MAPVATRIELTELARRVRALAPVLKKRAEEVST